MKKGKLHTIFIHKRTSADLQRKVCDIILPNNTFDIGAIIVIVIGTCKSYNSNANTGNDRNTNDQYRVRPSGGYSIKTSPVETTTDLVYLARSHMQGMSFIFKKISANAWLFDSGN